MYLNSFLLITILFALPASLLFLKNSLFAFIFFTLPILNPFILGFFTLLKKDGLIKLSIVPNSLITSFFYLLLSNYALWIWVDFMNIDEAVLNSIFQPIIPAILLASISILGYLTAIVLVDFKKMFKSK